MTYDCIIIGMGIAGVSAAIYAKRAGLSVLILEKERPGGIINIIDNVENYPGIKSIAGPDLSMNLFDQIRTLQIPYKIAEVTKLSVVEDRKKVETNEEVYYARNVIVATGRSPILLDLPNVKELVGKGISTCALCDGTLYKEKEIAVVGGGNSALQEALYLSKIVKKIYLIHRRDEFRASEELIKRIKACPNVEFVYNSVITKVNEEEGHLASIEINNEKTIPVSALFIYIGYAPKTDFAKDLEITNPVGYFMVDENYETKVKGIFAVGDIIIKKVYQIVTAAAEGATAAIYISHQK